MLFVSQSGQTKFWIRVQGLGPCEGLLMEQHAILSYDWFLRDEALAFNNPAPPTFSSRLNKFQNRVSIRQNKRAFCVKIVISCYLSSIPIANNSNSTIPQQSAAKMTNFYPIAVSPIFPHTRRVVELSMCHTTINSISVLTTWRRIRHHSSLEKTIFITCVSHEKI